MFILIKGNNFSNQKKKKIDFETPNKNKNYQRIIVLMENTKMKD